MNSSCLRAMKPLEHVMKVVESVLEIGLCRLVSAGGMLSGSMPERRTIDDELILRMLQEENQAKGSVLYMCFVDLEKAFDRVLRIIWE